VCSGECVTEEIRAVEWGWGGEEVRYRVGGVRGGVKRCGSAVMGVGGFGLRG